VAGASEPTWHARAATLEFSAWFAFKHAFLLSGHETAALRGNVVGALADARLEVREAASRTLAGMLRGAGAQASAELRARFLAAAGEERARRSREKRAGAPAPAPGEEELVRRHGTVLGLAACVLSCPYDCPEWMPEAVVGLCSLAAEPAPICDTVRKTFADFKRSHQDTWSATREAFTEDQWGLISEGLHLAPTYFA